MFSSFQLGGFYPEDNKKSIDTNILCKTSFERDENNYIIQSSLDEDNHSTIAYHPTKPHLKVTIISKRFTPLK